MDKRIKTVWILSISTIILILCVQLYWLNSQYSYSVEESVDRLKTDCTQALAEEQNIRKQLHAQNIKQPTPAQSDKDTTRINIGIDYDKKQDKTEMSVKYTFLENGKRCSLTYKNLENEQIYALIVKRNVSADYRFSPDTLSALLVRKGYGGVENFTFVEDSSLLLSPSYTLTGGLRKMLHAEYSTNPLLRENIRFDIPVPINDTVSNMARQLALSLVLIVLLALCMAYQIKTIVIQRKINALRHEFMKNMIMELKQPAENDPDDDEGVMIGSTRFLYSMNELQYDNCRVIITSRQAEILRLLTEHIGEPVARHELLNEVWGDDSYANSLALNVQITYLRRALKPDDSIAIEAIIKKGYVLQVKE